MSQGTYQYSNPMHPLYDSTRETNSRLHRQLFIWGRARVSVVSGLVEQGVLEDWLNGMSANEPNLVEYLRNYGHAHIAVRHWTDLPIKIDEADAPAWREYDYGATLEEFKDLILGVLGGFLSFAGRDLDRVTDLLERQLQERQERLKELLTKPLDYYTPLTFEEHGDEYFEVESEQDKRINEPFNLFEELTYFSYAMELARLRCFDYNEEINLPNVELFEALCDIDLIAINRNLSACEQGLKRIQHHLANHRDGEDDILTNSISAPDESWWRHWKPEPKRRPQHKRSGRSQQRRPRKK